MAELNSKFESRNSKQIRSTNFKITALSLGVSSLLLLSGCRKAAVDSHIPHVDTNVVVGEPAYVMKTNSDAPEPWYRNMQVVFEERPADEKSLDSYVAANKGPVTAAIQSLLQDVEHAVQDRHTANDKWSVLSMTCGRTKKGSEISFAADVGLTKLYARRPVIAFSNLPLELCVAKLSRESEIQFSQPRGYDPSVTWSKTNVSAAEAFEGVLTSHGFELKFNDTKQSVLTKAQDYSSREEFVRATADAIIQKGKLLNSARPAVIVTHKEVAPQPSAESNSKSSSPLKKLGK